jgi:hypothetical protein
MKITRRQLRQIIKEAVSIPVSSSDNSHIMLSQIVSSIERIRKTLKASSHEDLPYTEKAIGVGPERIDRALQKELSFLKKVTSALEKQLANLGMEVK